MSLNEEQNATTGPGKVSRRTLAVGAAWSVPVIAAASAAPFMAASPTPISFTGLACKHPGGSQSPYNQDYHYTLQITAPVPCTTGIVVTGVKMGTSAGNATSQNFCISATGSPPAAGCSSFSNAPVTLGCFSGTRILHVDGDNSSNNYIAISYTVNGVAQPDAVSTQTTPPCVTDDVCSGQGQSQVCW